MNLAIGAWASVCAAAATLVTNIFGRARGAGSSFVAWVENSFLWDRHANLAR